jgi:hypothetical protein
MSVQLRVAAYATALTLTLAPEMTRLPDAVAGTAVVQTHNHGGDSRHKHKVRHGHHKVRHGHKARHRREPARHRRHMSPQHRRHLSLRHRWQSHHRWHVRHMAHVARLRARRAALLRARAFARWQVRADRAVRFAYRQRGKPYRWGGTGPRGYDCSGLVQRAWRAAGVSIPRVTYRQYRMRPHISRRRLRPGDLVFFHGLGHVGIYVGHGRFIHSPHTGTRVRVERLGGYYRRAFAGAVRPAWSGHRAHRAHAHRPHAHKGHAHRVRAHHRHGRQRHHHRHHRVHRGHRGHRHGR